MEAFPASPCFWRKPQTLSGAFAPLLSTTAPGALVLVDERDLDRAQEIYNSFFGRDTTPLTGATLEDDEAVAGEEEA